MQAYSRNLAIDHSIQGRFLAKKAALVKGVSA